jgi:Bacteriophage Mu Gam like protein
MSTSITDDYTKLAESIESHTKVSNELAAIEASFQKSIQELISDVYRDEFAELTEAKAELEERIELLVLRHPEWFAKAKTLKTPHGSVATRKTTKIDVPSEEATIALLELRGAEAEPFLRTRKYLSVEALEALDDAELAILKCRRVTSEKITITPAKIDLGKSLKKTAGKEAVEA